MYGLRGVQVLGHVRDAAFEGDFAFRRIFGNDVGFCADDVEDDVLAQICFELFEPAAHLFKGLRVCDVITQYSSICACSRQGQYLEVGRRMTWALTDLGRS